MGQLRIRQLDRIEVRQIYGGCIKEDFPPDEIKPLERIYDMLDDDIYECTGLFAAERDAHMVGYAFFVKQKETKYYLLDYLAVNKNYRSKGYGSIYMEQMRRYFKHCKGIFLECESESSLGEWTDENHAVATQRRKRIQFYRNNGAVLTNAKSQIMGVDYSILYLPIKEEAGSVDYYQELNAIYNTMFPETARAKYARLWERHSVLLTADRAEDGETGVELKPKVSLCDALGIRTHIEDGKLRMIALTGAGGKTTTMYQLADELAEMGKRVIVTTSTHIAVSKIGQTILLDDTNELEHVIWDGRILTVGKLSEAGGLKKLKAPEDLDSCLNYADIVLVEADGSKQTPAKVMADWEPVIPAETDLVIGCLGLCAIGKSWKEACFRFEDHGGWLGKQPEELMTAEDFAVLLTDQRAVKKFTEDKTYRIVLNQADGGAEQKAALNVIKNLPKTLRSGAVITSYSAESPPHVHSAENVEKEMVQ